MADEQIRVGLYIGQGAPPPNMKADMAVDMTGKQIGVYIGGSSQKDLGDAIKDAIAENPKLGSDLEKFLADYRRSSSPQQTKGVASRLVSFLAQHSEELGQVAKALLKTLPQVL